jgi:hypothetical protein
MYRQRENVKSNQVKDGCQSEGRAVGTICGVEDAIKLVDDIFQKYVVNDQTVASDYQKNFGVWFRGQSVESWKPEPWIFRKKIGVGNSTCDVFWDETSMFHHFQLRVPEYHQGYRNTFDWLCLMQHYRNPTRLLDWTESVLVALFFAVCESEEHDGRLFALDVRRLNLQTSHSSREETVNVCKPDSLDVAASAHFARSRNIRTWKKRMNSPVSSGIWEVDDRDSDAIQELCRQRFYKKLDSPIAVLPRRLNGRMISQSSAFTIHSGKNYSSGVASESERQRRLPAPRSLCDINDALSDEEKFLHSYIIPTQKKGEIKDKLFKLGVRHGSLFPELDGQSKYMSDLWCTITA